MTLRRKAARPPRPRTHPGRKALAYHEAGHAVLGHLLGLEIERVTIDPDPREGSLGQCRYRDWEAWAAAGDLAGLLAVVLAGAVAEEIAMNAPSRGADEPCAWELARSRCASDAEAAGRVAESRVRVTRCLMEHWPAVKAVAVAVRRQRELDGSEAARTIRRALRGRQFRVQGAEFRE